MFNHLSALVAARAAMLKIRADERGVTALEYGLIAALIAVAIVTAVTSVGSNLNSTFTKIAGSL